MNTTPTIQVRQAAALLKEGKRDECVKIVVSVLKQNPSNEQALWIFAHATENLNHRRDALKKILAINPKNKNARQMLSKVNLQLSPRKTSRNERAKPFSGMSKRRRTIISSIVLLATFLIVAVFLYILAPKPYTGALLIGENAVEPGYIQVQVNATRDFDGLTREQIYELRSLAVFQEPTLVKENYRPSNAVFGQIEDGKPWWGMVGQWVYGAGDRSIVGDSEESRFILNPYLLASPEFYGLSIFGNSDYSTEFWKPDLDFRAFDFPYTCMVSSLFWTPSDKLVQSNYYVSGCFSDIRRSVTIPLTIRENGRFDLFAYNARDFGLNYIYVDYEQSENIIKQDAPNGAVAIPHYIHAGGSCGYPGGCNNMSPDFDPLSNLFFTELPASIHVKFWQNLPLSVSSEPTMTMIIRFR